MKNTSILIIALITLFAGIAIGYVVFGEESQNSMIGSHRMPDGTMMHNSDSSMMNGNQMDMSMDHSMMMVKSEREFITEMIPHHQEAIDTAKRVLEAGGSTPEIKALAEAIIIAQEKEITTMMDWHLNWYGTAYVPSGEYKPMMRDLSTLSGAELDRAFLEDMIPHHQGALMMAESVQPYITKYELRGFAAGIIETQTEEIRTMRQLLTTI